QKIDGNVFNAGFDNHTVGDIAGMVKTVVGGDLKIVVQPTDDNRSYHISSEKIKKELGFSPKRTITDAVKDLVTAFKAGKIPDSMNDPHYFNIKMMQKIHLT